MLRRRRPQKSEAIHFSFDSFLDLVTNVVGIIIRLILVTWVSARSYHSSMQWLGADAPAPEDPPAETAKELPPPKASDEPLYSKIEIARQEMADAKARLTARLKELADAETKADKTKDQIFTLTNQRDKLEFENKSLTGVQSARGAQVQLASLSLDEIRRRSKKLLQDLKALEGKPLQLKQLKYHAPLSRAVHSDEIFFECQNGRVTYIDLPAFTLEWEQARDNTEVREELKRQWKVERVTSQVGAYRVRYVLERVKTVLDGPVPAGNHFSFGLSAWTVEPVVADRGETLPKALTPGSQFRQMVDPLDGSISTVTIWVYPDSFEMFRHLRDYLYERGLDVAGRPLPPGWSIAASRHGTASRGQ